MNTALTGFTRSWGNLKIPLRSRVWLDAIVKDLTNNCQS